MKNLKLNFIARVRLSNMLGLATGNLGKMAALQHIWKIASFSEDEQKQITITDLGNGASNWVPPSPEWGAVDAPIEDAYAAVLLQEIDSLQGFRVSDVEWAEALKKQLTS